LDNKNYARWCKSNITENEFAEENQDYFPFVIDEERKFNPNPTQDFKLTASFAKKLSMTAKSEKGELARQYFIAVEDGAKEMALQFREMSPQLQFMINMEAEQKRQAKELIEVKERSQQAIERVESIREVVALNPNDWRKDTSALINKMALKCGGYEHIRVIREESYKLLEQRYGVALNIRLTNKKKTMALNGVCKSKLDKLNQLDVIADDKKLIEGYVSIVKEMAIKYGVA
jgi:anti-repressor protein